MRKIALVLGFLFVAAAAAAASNSIFVTYEGARQALLKGSLADVQKAARQISAAARGTNQRAIAEKAAALEKSSDLASARTAFAALSDQIITYRFTVSGAKPVVAYCSMEKKSWLQPRGTIANPYVAAPMRACGEIKQQ